MANISMTHRTEGLLWLKLLLLLANRRVIYKHLLIWIHKPNGGKTLAVLVAMVTSISHMYPPAAVVIQNRNPKATCSFKYATCSIFTPFTFLIENRWVSPPVPYDWVPHCIEAEKIFLKNLFLRWLQDFSWGILQTDVTSNQFWLSIIKGIPPQVQLSAMCWRWYGKKIGVFVFTFKELIAGVTEHKHK